MASCAVNSFAASAAIKICEINPSLQLDATVVNQLIEQGIEQGLFTREQAEQEGTFFLVDRLIPMLESSSDIDISFTRGSAFVANSTEAFSGENSRAAVATHYIGINRADTKGLQTRMQAAYAAAGRTILNKDSRVDSNTVATVEVTTNSDVNAVIDQCVRVLEAGGRLLFPTTTEVSKYASTIVNNENRKNYENMRLYIQRQLADRGYSSRNVEEKEAGVTAMVVQKTKNQVFEKLEFAPDSRAVNIKAVNEGVDAQTLAQKAKTNMTIKVNTSFVKNGASLKDPKIKALSLYDAILSGEVDTIVRSDTKNNNFSSLQKGDIIPLRQDSGHVIFAEVTEIQPNASKSQYIEQLENGSIVTGYSLESAKANVKDDASLSIIKFKPLGQGTLKSESKKKSSSKSQKDSNVEYVKRKFSYYDKKKHKRVSYWKSVPVRKDSKADMNALTILNKFTTLIDKMSEKLGVKVETISDQQAAQITESPEMQSLREKLEEADYSEKAAIAHEIGYLRDVSSTFGVNHTFIGQFHDRQAALQEVFNDDYARMDQFGKSMMAFFRNLAEKAVIPEKLQEYQERIDKLDKLIESKLNEEGRLATRTELNAFKEEKQSLLDRASTIKKDGWLGAVRVSDVLTATLASLTDELDYADQDLYWFKLALEKDENKGKSFEDLCEEVYKETEDGVPQDDYLKLIRADLKQPSFLEKLFDGWRDPLSTEDPNAVQTSSGDDASRQAEIDLHDSEIQKRRDHARDLRRAVYDRVCYEITKATGVRVSLRVTRNTGEKSEEEENADEANDSDTFEENTRDMQMVANFEKNMSDSLSKQVKRILGSQCEWDISEEKLEGTPEQRNAQAAKYEQDYAEWPDMFEIIRDDNGDAVSVKWFYEVAEEIFGFPKAVSFGVTFNHLLHVLNEANGGLGMRNGEELYQYLHDNQEQVSWYHGIVYEMEKDSGVKTAFFTAFKKRHMKFRSINHAKQIFGGATMKDASKKKCNDYVSLPENYDENAEFLAAAIQETQTHGLILAHGEIKGVKVRVVKESAGTKDTKRKFKGENVELADISVYNTSGLFNEGTIVGDKDAKGNYTNITKMTGAYAFSALVNTLPTKADYVSLKASDPNHVLYKTRMALLALGVQITKNQIDLAFATHPDRLNRCLQELRSIGTMVDPITYTAYGSGNAGLYTDVVYDHLSTALANISEAVVAISQMAAESSHRWKDKTFYSWANPTMIDEITSELGNTTSEEDFMKYVNERFLHSDNPEISESFFMQRDANGNAVPTCTWLRAMIPASDSAEDIKKAHYARALFRLGYYANHGYTDKEGKTKDYEHMSASMKTTIEILNFFSPPAGNGRSLSEELQKNIGITPYDVACYAFPIMADSGNHIFFGGRRYRTKRSKDFGTVKPGEYLDSHTAGSLLDGCADVVMQEYNRIKIYRSNAINGQEIKRTPLHKTLNKNKEKFMNFPDLNNVRVLITSSIDGETSNLSFVEAIQYLSTQDNVDSLVSEVEVQDAIGLRYVVSRTDGVELYRDMIMEAIQKCYLNPSFRRSLKFWDEMGMFAIGASDVVKTDDEEYGSSGVTTFTSLQSEDRTFIEAAEQFDKRDSAIYAFLNQIFDQSVEIYTDPASGMLAVRPRPKQTDNNFLTIMEDKPFVSSTWDAIVAYEDIAAGINAGDLAQWLLSFKDKDFNSRYYELDEQERETENQRQQAICAAISNIINSEATDPKSGAAALNRLLTDSVDPSQAYRNLLLEAMQEYAFNKVFAKTQVLQMTVGDIAQFKNEGDLSKRFKGVVAAYERCDMSATDPYRGNRLVKDYYGETAILDEKWKENQKCITIADFEAKKEKGSDRSAGFVNISDFFNTQLLPLLQQDLDAGVIDRQTYADYCSGYTKMNISDGQSFRTLESMRKLCQFLGLNTEGMEDIYQKVVVDGETLKWEDVRDFMQQMKTVSFGYQQLLVEYSANDYSDTQGAMKLRNYAQQLVDFTKDSQFTLMLYTDEMNKYLGGKENILKGMLEFAKKNQVDCIHFESTKKTGQTNIIDLTQCHNAQEAEAALNAAMQAGKADPALDIFHAESWRNVGRQISTPEHLIDKEQGIGSQSEKLIEADLPETYEISVKDPVSGKVHKETRQTLIYLRDEDGNPTDALTPARYKELLTRIKITNMREDLLALEKDLGSEEALSKLLIDQLDKTDKYPDDLKDALTVDPYTHKFRLPLDHPVVLRAIEPLIASLIRKRVVKQKTKGGTAIQFSSVGRSENLKEVWGQTEDGQPYVKYIECMLPAWSKKLFQAFADENGDIDINKVPVKLREMVGYRVPTEHLYSIAPLRVVGFLNQAQGSSIMLPQEIVVWSGSDFDIDKMFLEIPDFKIIDKKEVLNCSNKEAWTNFYATAEGQQWKGLCVKQWSALINRYVNDNDANLSDEAKSQMLDLAFEPEAHPENFRAFRKQWCEIVGKGKGRMFDSITAIEGNEQLYGDLQHDFQAFLEQNGYYDYLVKTTENTKLTGSSTQEDISSASRMDRNNMLINLHFARLTCPQSLKAINQPGGFSAQKRMSRLLAVLSSPRNGLSYEALSKLDFEDTKDENGNVIEGLDTLAEKYQSRLDIMDAHTDDLMFERNMTGKQMVAISALHNSFHALIQNAPIDLSTDFLAQNKAKLNGKELRKTLGAIYDESGHYILRNIGGILAAAVDNAKDPVLGELNISQKNCDWVMTLLHLGYSIDTVCLLMAQPVVKIMTRDGWIAKRLIKEHGKDMHREDVDMTHEQMANSIKNASINEGNGLSLVDCLKDPVQCAAVDLLASIELIASPLNKLMEATKISQPKNSFQNNYGETYTRMAAIKNKGYYNQIKRYNQDRSVTVTPIFDNEQYNSIVVDKFDRDNDSPMSVDDYISGYDTGAGDYTKARLPYIQACYDFGFARPLRYISRFIGNYGKDTEEILDRLNQMFKEVNKTNLSADIINSLLDERRLFSTINTIAAEEMEANSELTSVSDVRRAYLTSFPEYFSHVLQNYLENGTPNKGQADPSKSRDLRSEFAILRHIVHEKPKNKGRGKHKAVSVLKFSKGGKVDKMIQNELITSWNRMLFDRDQTIRNLAVQMFKYSMFFNGCKFSPTSFGTYAPTSLLNEYVDYNEALRDLRNSMTSEQQALFIDQFIRNHVNEFSGYNGLIGMLDINPKNEKDAVILDNFFDAKPYTDNNGKKRTSYTPKQGEIRYWPGDKAEGYFPYLKIKPSWSSDPRLFRRMERHSDGRTFYYYVAADELGYAGFPEYDPEHDLLTSTRIGFASYQDALDTLQQNALANEQKMKEQARIARQQEILTQLAEHCASVTDDRSTGAVGNNAKHYVRNGENFERTHTYMEQILKVPQVQKPDSYSDEEWALAQKAGQTIGQAFDAYARLYFKRLNNGSLSEADQKKMDYIADTNNGYLPNAGINFYYFNSALSNGKPLSLQQQFEEVCDRIAREFPGAKFYTELNGNNIRIANEIMTKNGPMKLGGELDMLVALPDGRFAIVDFKQMKNSRFGWQDFKAKATTGNLAPDLANGNSFYEYSIQQNCYRSILLSLYDDMEIEGLYIAPVITDRQVDEVDANGNVLRGREVAGKRLHPGATNERLWLSSVYASNYMDMSQKPVTLFPIRQDPALSGIPDPTITTDKERQAADLAKQAEQKGLQDQPSKNYSSYKAIFDDFLTPEQSAYFNDMASLLDGDIPSEVETMVIRRNQKKQGNEPDVTAEQIRSEKLSNLSDFNKTNGASDKFSLKTAANRANMFLEEDEKDTISDNTLQKLFAALKRHRDTVGDDNVKNCK
jgi:hypothetical protein